MLCGYFGIATLALIIEVNTRSLYFNMKSQQQNGKLKLSSAIIRDTGELWSMPSWYRASQADYLQASRWLVYIENYPIGSNNNNKC